MSGTTKHLHGARICCTRRLGPGSTAGAAQPDCTLLNGILGFAERGIAQGTDLVEIGKSFETVTHHDVSKHDCLETTIIACVSLTYPRHLVHIQHCVGAGESSVTPAPAVCTGLPAEVQQHACDVLTNLIKAHAVVILCLRLALAGRPPYDTRRLLVLVALWHAGPPCCSGQFAYAEHQASKAYDSLRHSR